MLLADLATDKNGNEICVVIFDSPISVTGKLSLIRDLRPWFNTSFFRIFPF